MTPTPSTAPEAPELKPCPWPNCGSDKTAVLVIWKQFQACCLACSAEGPVADSREDAITAWNTRPTPPAAGWLQAASEEIAELSQKGVLTAQAVKQLLAVHCCVPVAGWMERAAGEYRTFIEGFRGILNDIQRGYFMMHFRDAIARHSPDSAKLESEVARLKEENEKLKHSS